MAFVNLKWPEKLSKSSFDIFSRSLAAIFGGYLVAATACGLLALTLPLPVAESVLTAMMLSFALYAIAALWAFSVKRSRQAWRDLLCISTLFYLLILLLG